MKKLCTALLFLSIGVSAFASDLAPKGNENGAKLENATTLKANKIEISIENQAVGALKREQKVIQWTDDCGTTMNIYVSAPQGTPYGDYWMTAAYYAVSTIRENGGCW
ncbi:hypothetical protein PQ465_08595 [Sphingobacterium oryzagri]|uniref:Uncharacterized protein n=1 Tax=Sphingobacterium oryzagri TaxID=3025669 RepID=A0ABY7WQ18_9SPHI|nr:hypothetical protein [Sphingobacterium sp. KACC 22765]WDF70420.1 hypothetical protein PQ465_08595 [Sphingobacterium sp. KACC 22765]